MPIDNSNILAEIRALLLLWDEVTDLCDMRIRVDGFAIDDGTEASVMLEIVDSNQMNFLEESRGCVTADVLVTCRCINETTRTELAEAIRSRNTDPTTGLDGYRGAAGNGWIIQSNRTDSAAGKLYDADGDETDFYEQRDLYRIMYRL
jgi:hypothetical protein